MKVECNQRGAGLGHTWVSIARKCVLALAVAGLGAGSFVAPSAQAQLITNDPIATMQIMLSEIKRAADAAKQYSSMAQQLKTQIDQYQDMARNSKKLTESQWYTVSRDIRRLKDVYSQTKALAYDAQQFDKRFKSTFKDYKTFSSEQRSKSFEEEYANWADSGFDNAKAAMKAGGMQIDMMADEDALLADLVSQSQSAGGRMEALQVANQIAAQQVQQSQKLRQLLAAQTNMQAQALAQATQRQAAEDANTNRFFNDPKKSKGREF